MSKTTENELYKLWQKLDFLAFINYVSDIDSAYSDIQEKPSGWVLKAIAKRFEAHQLQACKKLQIYVLWLGNGTVGRCAKWVDNIALIANQKQVNKVDLDSFRSFYPYTIPDF